MVIKKLVSTEKAIRLMEAENKLVFVVEPLSNKAEIKKAVEEMFGVKVVNVNTLRNMKGEKRAFVQFADDSPAIDIATQVGMM